MANLNFYGLKNDLLKLLSFIYDETDIVVYELSSEFDREIRRFKSLKKLESTFDIGQLNKGQLHLKLWSASVMKEPQPRRINLTMKEHSFRYTIEGAGLMQLYLGGLNENVIDHTHCGHWNQAGAEAKSISPAKDCNWETLKKVSGRLQRFIRGMAVAKLHSRVILAGAFSEIKSGKQLRFLNQNFDAQSKEIVLLREKTS
jgi:hypothetical protein